MLSEVVLDRCRAIPTSTWSDAIDATGAGAVCGLILRSGAGRAAGRALTVQEECRAFGSFQSSDFSIGSALKLGRAGDVLVVAMGGATVSTFGGLAARSAAAQGFAAVMIDGGCRDVEELRETGLMVASRHLTPISGRGRVRINSINEPIVCDGIAVAAGDLVVIDATGSVVVPQHAVADVLAAAEALESRDQTMQAAIAGGANFEAAMSKHRP